LVFRRQRLIKDSIMTGPTEQQGPKDSDKPAKEAPSPANVEPNQPGMGEDEDKDRPPGGKR
jgi:hypothetical protein